jgi:hypothetical protein
VSPPPLDWPPPPLENPCGEAEPPPPDDELPLPETRLAVELGPDMRAVERTLSPEVALDPLWACASLLGTTRVYPRPLMTLAVPLGVMPPGPPETGTPSL